MVVILLLGAHTQETRIFFPGLGPLRYGNWQFANIFKRLPLQTMATYKPWFSVTHPRPGVSSLAPPSKVLSLSPTRWSHLASERKVLHSGKTSELSMTWVPEMSEPRRLSTGMGVWAQREHKRYEGQVEGRMKVQLQQAELLISSSTKPIILLKNQTRNSWGWILNYCLSAPNPNHLWSVVCRGWASANYTSSPEAPCQHPPTGALLGLTLLLFFPTFSELASSWPFMSVNGWMNTPLFPSSKS